LSALSVFQCISVFYGAFVWARRALLKQPKTAVSGPGSPTEQNGVPFAAISFCGLVGVVTGFSQHIAMSEKVWETYRSPDVQPGTYAG
jgi:hypothetical protein